MPQPSTLALKVATDVDFQKRVRLLAADVAGDVLAEANSVSSHNKRATYAAKLLNNLAEEGKRVAFIVVAENLSAAASVGGHEDFSDAAVKTAITSLWNQLADVYTPESV